MILEYDYLFYLLIFYFQEEGASASVQDPNRVKSLQSQVDGVTDIMTQNVERILARGERLDDLMDKSEDLQAGVRKINKHQAL